ncbi:MAG: tRNA cyclic N6-threonylcarbamoyladenosine(37) synthase TcdA [Verrucomicrobiota bacterium]
MPDATHSFEFRFGGVGRLYGPKGLERIRAAHVCIIGIGGVGSWSVEALARSGVGQLTLVDLDDICESNINRQIHAKDGEIGKPKIEVMAQRCREINPEAEVRVIHSFFTEKTIDQIFDVDYDYVVDAIDSVKHKCRLLATCRDRGIPIIAVGGAGGRIDPTRIQVSDLSKTYNDKLLQRTRKMLRSDFGFPKQANRKFKIDCVFSPEDAVYPEICDTDSGEKTSHRLDCSSGYGAVTHLTGAFGFIAAAEVLKNLSAEK